MTKRTHRQIRKAILEALNDGKEHSCGYLERKVNTNWMTVRDHCEDLKLIGAVTISEDKIKIVKLGSNLLKRL